MRVHSAHDHATHSGAPNTPNDTIVHIANHTRVLAERNVPDDHAASPSAPNAPNDTIVHSANYPGFFASRDSPDDHATDPNPPDVAEYSNVLPPILPSRLRFS